MAVKIYTTSACHFCKEAKKFFKEHDVKFTEINVENDTRAAGEMIEKSGQMGVPVIDVDGKIVVGFDKGALKKALEL